MNEELAILNKSKRRVVKLKLLSKFFNQASLVSIAIKTEIIHSLFKENVNNDFDFSKLELFHLQYSDSLIELLDKIKRQKETSILLHLNEIEANEDFIEKYSDEENNQYNFETDRKFHSANISTFLANYYKKLTDENADWDIKNIQSFSEKYAINYYRKQANLVDIIAEMEPKFYEYKTILVEKKLLGRLNIKLFKARFVCGYINENKYFELFKIFQSEDFFLWDISKNQFFLLDSNQLTLLNTSKNKLQNLSIGDKLKQKNIELKNKIDILKKTVPNSVVELLNSYKETLENTEVLNKSFCFDEETNILKAMLNLNLNNQ